MEAGLYIVGTPIGNLADMTYRAVETLSSVSAILAEDTRRTGILLHRYGIRTRMISCHRFNEASRVEAVLARLAEGAAIGLVSNAGMPAVSDPGARIVYACRAAGHAVHVVPGVSAVTAAVAWSGLVDGPFHFEGFLPRKTGARARRLAELCAAGPPFVVYESPYRLASLLAELAAFPSCRIFVAREVSKVFEEGVLGTAEELARHFAASRIRGEITVVVGGGD